MCRLVAHLGQEVALSELLYDPPRSLEAQAHSPRELQHGIVNVDGTGVVWWPAGEAEPLRYVSVSPPWSDANLPLLAPRLRSATIVAAVRSASPGIPFGAANVAPFMADDLAFSHNGWLGGFRQGVRRTLEAELPDDVYALADAVSDSQVVFLTVLAALRAGADLATAVTDTLQHCAQIVRSVGQAATLNVVATDGTTLVATRSSVDLPGNSLYVLEGPDGVRVASEPLDHADPWRRIDDGTLLVATRAGVTCSALAL